MDECTWSKAGSTRTGQHSLCPASGGLAACFVRDEVLPRASGYLSLPLNSPREKPASAETVGWSMMYAMALGYVFPFLGSTAMIIVSTKRNYHSGKKKKETSYSPFA